MDGLSIRLLGGFELLSDDRPVILLDRPRLQTLLAYLILHRAAPQSRQRLAFLLWPDSTDKQARTNLRNLLHTLRRALPQGDALLHITPKTVQWSNAEFAVVDVVAFEEALRAGQASQDAGNVAAEQDELERAVGVYRGELLPDHYDDWVLTERERLSSQYAAALARLTDLLEARRDYPAALEVAQRLLRHDPLQEETYRLLMRLHALNGDRPAALRTYHACVIALQEELAVDPDPLTQEAYQRLLNLEEGPAPPVAHQLPAGRIPLVGRQAEWQALTDAWKRSQRGQPRLMLIGGGAGIGKTRLAEELVDLVRRQGFTVASARAYEAEGDMAYAPVASWLRSDALHPGIQKLEDVWLWEVGRLLPQVLARRPDLTRPEPGNERLQQRRFSEALARAVLSNTQPLLLHLDDLQWCDRETLAWLAFLLSYDRRGRLLVMCTASLDEISPDHPLIGWIYALRQAGVLDEISLGPLNGADTARLASHVSGADLDAAAAAHLYAETEGNPLFVVEMAQAGWESVAPPSFGPATDQPAFSPLPSKIRAVLERRFAQLSPQARELAQVAAVIGREFRYEILAAASGQGEDALVAGLDELWQRRIVRELGANGYDFSHGKLRELAYQQIGQTRLRWLHRQVAQALGERVSREQDIYPAAVLARHYLKAGDVDAALVHLLAAGDQARALYANTEAEGFYRAASEILQEGGQHELAARTLIKLGLVHTAAFQPEQAQQVYDRAFTLWSAAADRPAAGFSARAGASLRMAVGEPATLDPGRADDSDSYFVQYQLFEGLVTSDADYNIVPAMAERWEVLDGGARYLFHLREDARWNDGNPVRAQDFEYAWQRNLAPATRSPAAQLLGDLRHARPYMAGQISDPSLVGVRALDDHVLEIYLEGPTAYLLHLLAHPIAFPQPRWAIEAHGQAWAEPGHLVCNGAFELVEREPGTRLLLRRNPAYAGRFPGNADQVELLVFNRWRLALEAYASDAVDLIDMAAADARSMAVARTFYSEDMVFTPLLNTNYLIFRADRPPFDDVRVRQGFVYATDRRAVGPDLLLQANVPAIGGFVPPWMPGHSPDIGLAYDPERGRRLLAEAGFPDGRDFPTVTFLHTHGLCDESLIPFLQGQWRQNLGIDVEVTTLPWREFQRRVRTDPPHLMLAGWIADYPDPDNFLRMVFHSTRGLNEPGWHHARFDALVDEAARVADQTRRMALYGEADHILTAEATVIMPLSYGRGAVLMKPWVGHASGQRVPTRYLKELSVEMARAPTDRSELS